MISSPFSAVPGTRKNAEAARYIPPTLHRGEPRNRHEERAPHVHAFPFGSRHLLTVSYFSSFERLGEQLSAAEKQTANYIKMKQLHAQFHEAASNVAQHAISGDREAAENAMKPSSDYARLSLELTTALNKWIEGV